MSCPPSGIPREKAKYKPREIINGGDKEAMHRIYQQWEMHSRLFSLSSGNYPRFRSWLDTLSGGRLTQQRPEVAPTQYT